LVELDPREILVSLDPLDQLESEEQQDLRVQEAHPENQVCLEFQGRTVFPAHLVREDRLASLDPRDYRELPE